MKKIILATFATLLASTFVSSCSQDPSKYDITSPCVSNASSIYLDQPCEKRLPIENLNNSHIIAIL